jgi:hypothetical protein
MIASDDITMTTRKTARFELLSAVVDRIASDDSIALLPVADLTLRLSDLQDAGHLVLVSADGQSVTLDLHPCADRWLTDFMAALPADVAKTFAPRASAAPEGRDNGGAS